VLRRRPLLCLVTDRLSLARAWSRPDDPVGALLDQVASAAAAGVDLVHVRERDLDARALVAVVRRCVARTRGTATRVVVNDRVDVALSAGADGVHLRSDSVDAGVARGLLPRPRVVGRSVRSADEARRVAADGQVDYLVLGTIFRSGSAQRGKAVVGPGELARAVRAARVPVLAIGGVTDETLPAVAQAGAAGFAAISLFQRAAPRLSLEAVDGWRTVFDSVRTIS
jgi:thiamine-phosphate pyrophosphorylase